MNLAAVNEIVDFLGMSPVDKTNQAPKKTKHILLLAGRWIGDVPVMAQVRQKEMNKKKEERKTERQKDRRRKEERKEKKKKRKNNKQ